MNVRILVYKRIGGILTLGGSVNVLELLGIAKPRNNKKEKASYGKGTTKRSC